MSNYETNPVGALQERFQSRAIVPQYYVFQAEGVSHDPTFVFQVILGDLTATGTGSIKKQAKYSAARAMLDKLDGRVLTRDGQAPQPPVTDAASKPDAPGNTVRTLEELDVKKDAGWEHDSEGSSTRCFVDEKDIDLKECDERCLKHPQGLIRRHGIKINLITLEKSKEVTELDNNGTNEDLQSSQHVDSQIMKAVSNELQIKSINNNIAENLGQEEPAAWMKNIKSPQKVYLSPEKLVSYLKNDHQNELSRDLETRFPENERGRSQERRSSRESQLKNQHRKIFESDIDDLLNNCRKDVDFSRRSEDSKNNSRKSEKSRKRSRSRRSRSRRRSTQRHQRERERDQSNYDKRNASLTFIGKGKENEKHFMNITKKNNKNSEHFDIDVFNEGEMVD